MAQTAALPEDLNFKDVSIFSSDGSSQNGKIAFKSWSEQERSKRAAKKTVKIVGTIFGCSLIGLFVHVLLVVIIPTLILTLLAAVPLYMKFKGEDSTFYYVEGGCPHCNKKGHLRPYVDSKLRENLTVQCADCGQTVRVTLPSPQSAAQG